MKGFDYEGGEASSNPNYVNGGAGELGDNVLFDASQYAFFSKDVMEDAELGGLEDEDGDNVVLAGFGTKEYNYYSIEDREEVDVLASLSGIDDLTSTFAKLNRTVSEPRTAGVIGDRGSYSRESSSTTDWTQETDFPNWIDQQILEAEHAQESKRWWSQPHLSSHWLADAKPLYRSSSSPQHQQQQYVSSEPTLEPKSSFTNFPPPGGQLQPPANLTRHSSIPSLAGRLQMAGSNLSPYPNAQYHLGGSHRGLHLTANMSQVRLPGLSLHNKPRDYWSNQGDLFVTEHQNLPPNLLPQHLSLPRHLVSTQMSPQQQQQILQQQPPSHLSHSHPNLFTYNMNKFDGVIVIPDLRDQRSKSSQRGRRNMQISRQPSETSSLRSENSLPQFRSKYMSADEIESILRMQNAATHSNDPYDDYYHQACIAKRSAGSGLNHNFCPKTIKDLPFRSRGSSEQHAYLQVDALGRLPFSSVRRPRPLLEVDTPSSSDYGIHLQKSSVKPLEQETMLAARITIEDGICVLLDIDDIDRFLEVNPPQDGGSQLRRKRQILLEMLAASLELVDPLDPGKPGHSFGLSPKDDLVFLRIMSLPKGRKMLSRFLRLLIPGIELARVVCMAIFRHLRFLFGGLSSDLSAADATNKLAESVSLCVRNMELSALSSCLAAVVCSSEQPPLRPFESSAGDGASIIIKSVLDQATALLTDPHTASNYNVNSRTLWQASFDSFFGLLTKYCLNKYDSIMQMLIMHSPNISIMGSDATLAINREMPVELLRASLPHTNEHQRKILVEYAQKTTDWRLLDSV